jgi:glycosyltransferase involved in cell wall biosynthesis
MRATQDTAPHLSIILATYNAEAYIERCLNSILNQDYCSWELLIADGLSTDKTVEIIKRFKARLAWWQSQNDNGIYDAWNQALANASGEYVMFLGADDTIHSRSTLSGIFNAIGNRNYDLVTGRGLLMDCHGTTYHEFGNPWNYHKVARRMTICHPGALHRRTLFARYGQFDTTYRISADYDFLLRLPASTKTLHLNEVIVDVADTGVSRNRRWLMLRERFRAQAKCPRVGYIRASVNYLDKLWRIPVAYLLGIPN